MTAPSSENVGKWLPLVTAAILAVYAYGVLNQRVVTLEIQQRVVDQTRFTEEDGDALAREFRAEIRLKNAFIRQICNDLSRLYRELDRVPPNDCARP